jgi:hypothetical protein
VLEQAMRATTSKDPGSSKTISAFSVLQEVPVDHLLAIANDSSIVFSSAAGSPTEIILAIRAKELAQAELALARAKIDAHQAKEKARTNTNNKDETAGKSMEVDDTLVESPQGSGVAKETPQAVAKRKKAPKKQIPVGHRLVTRQARAKGVVS